MILPMDEDELLALDDEEAIAVLVRDGGYEPDAARFVLKTLRADAEGEDPGFTVQ